MDDSRAYDVVIVGGGIAGCATALSLTRSNPTATFLLIDNADPGAFKIGESLPAEAVRLLQFLSPSLVDEVRQDTEKGVHSHCTGNASIWDSPEVQETYALMNPYGAGWHLDRAAFDECLRKNLTSGCGREGRGQLVKGTLIEARRHEHAWKVTAKSDSGETSYRSKWLVDASGRKACVAQKLGVGRTKMDDLLAYYAVFKTPNVDLDHRTLIEATSTGWWYSSQVADCQRVVVFHTDDKDPTAKRAKKLEDFIEMLHTDTHHISQALTESNYDLLSAPGLKWPRCTAANSSFLTTRGDAKERWCAVGDAAMAFDPLSSQGMITALRMGCLAGIMLAKDLSADLPSSESFQGFQTQYGEVQKDYEKKKRYFYSQSMFDGPFWKRRR